MPTTVIQDINQKCSANVPLYIKTVGEENFHMYDTENRDVKPVDPRWIEAVKENPMAYIEQSAGYCGRHPDESQCQPRTPTPPTCQEKCVEQFGTQHHSRGSIMYVEDACATHCINEAADQRNFEEAKSLRATPGAIPIVREYRHQKPRLDCSAAGLNTQDARACEDFKANHFNPINDQCEHEFDFVQGFNDRDVGDCMDARLLPLEKDWLSAEQQRERQYESCLDAMRPEDNGLYSALSQ